LSDAGIERLAGDAVPRALVFENLADMLGDPDVDSDSIFALDDGVPTNLQKAARSRLVDGLPFFSYDDGLKKFRDEMLHISAKKVNSSAELQSLLPKEKAHLRAKKFMFDEREMNELISAAHSPTRVLAAEEIEQWFRLQINRQPGRVLESRRDRLWANYQAVEERIQNISQLLRAYTLYHRDVEYVVKTPEEGEMRRAGVGRGQKAVMIVDSFTGRLMPGRRFSDGLHEALEAKEGVQVQAESQTLATITLQNFFRLYNKLAGMTGTAETESQEFFSTYKLQVLVIPTNRPVVRDDFNDVIYRTRQEKYNAVIDEALEMHEQGRPVLIGTVSVDVSQHLSNLFTARGIPLANWLKKGDVTKELESGRFHTVLNAKHHKSEAEIVAKAGLPGAITIATNMAGRGTDIKLSAEIIKNGGLHIIGSEKHEARHIDRQLRGRAGRQGDPGSSRFYLSLEDDLMRLFGSDRITNIMSSMGSMDDGERIEHSLITKSIERAQKKVEERNFEIRKQLLEYDDVLNEQRKIIYKRRQNLLGFAQAEDYVESKLKKFIEDENDRSTWKLEELLEDVKNYFGVIPAEDIDALERLKYSELESTLQEWVAEQIEYSRHFNQLQERHRIFGYADVQQVLTDLVKLKIRLHNAGTTDVSRWNVDGIKFELERIFEQAPDWLTEAGGSADELELKIVDWAQDVYQQKVENSTAAFNDILLTQLPLDDFIAAFIFGLINLHMPQDQAPINWRTEDFLADLDRIFGGHPDIGANEMKSIRMSKLVDMCNDWISTVQLPEEISIRHRVLGYFGSIRFVEAVIARRLFEHDATAAKELSPADAAYFNEIFGQSFKVATDEHAEAKIVQLIRQARQAYKATIREHQHAYDDVMIANALNEELLEAAIHTVVGDILAAQPDQAGAQKELSRRLDHMFLAKPDVTVPQNRDANSVAVFTEDVVAWGLAFYNKYSDRVERIQQEELSSEIVSDSVVGMIDDTIYAMIAKSLDGDDILDSVQARRLESECRLIFRQAPRITDDSSEGMDPNAVMDEISEWAKNLYYKRVHELGRELVTKLERYYVLEKIDENWRQHLHGVDELREGIGLRGYGQKDPLLEYKREAFAMFERTIDSMNRETVSTLFKVFDVGGEMEDQQMRRIEPQSFTTSHSQVEVFNQAMKQPAQKQQQQRQPRPGERQRQKTVVNTKTIGRNEPCPCGSGKKYKNCCGKNV
jgi:preprotein translocase subunit SecA